MRAQTKVEFSYRNCGAEDRKFYVPSKDEARAHAALQAGKREEALRLFDDAIAEDPSRGARIYWTLNRARAPLQDVYWGFCKADLERSAALRRGAVEDVRERRLARVDSLPARCARWAFGLFVREEKEEAKRE